MRAVEGDAESETELAVLVGAVLGFLKMGIEEFFDRVDGGLAFGGLLGYCLSWL